MDNKYPNQDNPPITTAFRDCECTAEEALIKSSEYIKIPETFETRNVWEKCNGIPQQES